MNTQLIIFTQDNVNAIPNNSSFTTINSVSTNLTAGWQIIEPSGVSSGTTPLISGVGYAYFTSLTSYGNQSIKQQTNCDFNKQYKLKYKISFNSLISNASNDDKLILKGGGNNVVNSNVTLADDVGEHEYTFTCNANNGIIEIELQTAGANVVANALTIDYVLINPISEKDTLDLYDNEVIPMTYTISDIRDISTKNSSYSKDFDLPATKKNNKYFNHIYEINADSTFNPYRKARAILKQQGTTIFEGSLQLMKITKKGDGEIIYTVSLFNESSNLAEILKDRKLHEVPLHDLNHASNFDAMMKSWNSAGSGTIGSSPYNGTNSFGDKILYPMVRYNDNTNAGFQTYDFFSDIDTMRPFIKVKELFTRILTNAGYTYDSNFIDGTTFGKLYMDLNFPANEDFLNGFDMTNNAFYVQASASYSLTLSSTAQTIDFSLDTLASGGTNNISANNYEYVLGTDTFTSNADGLVVIVSGTTSITWGGSTSDYVDIELHHGGYGVSPGASATPVVKRIENTLGLSGNVPVNTFNFDPIVLDNTETFILKARGSGATIVSCPACTSIGHGAGSVGSTQIQVTVGGSYIVPNNILKETKGDYSQWDYVNSFIKIFNLVIEPDIDNPKKLIIEPYNDYIDSGDIKDWTSKVDFDANVDIQMIGELTKNILFAYTDDPNDYHLQEYKRTVGETAIFQPNTYQTGVPLIFGTGASYGSHKYETDRDYYDNMTTIIDTGIFAPTVYSTLYHAYNMPSITLPAIYGVDENGDSKSINNVPRLLFNNGVQDLIHSVGGWFYYSPSGTTFSSNTSGLTQANKVLAFNHYDEHYNSATLGDADDLNFGIVQPYVFNDSNTFQGQASFPVNNIFIKYWKDYIDLIYSKNSKIVTFEIFLTPADIQSFTFKNSITIKGVNYRVNKIEYVAGARNNKTKLELIKK
jgi:hypothetical protein